MKIHLSTADQELLNKLLETKYNNMSIADMLNQLCFSLDQFNELNTGDKKDFSTQAVEALFDYFELDENNGDNIYFKEHYLLDTFIPTNMDEYELNPYKKSVNIKELSHNGYHLHYLSYPQYSFFPLDDVSVDESNYYQEHYKIGFALKPYSYLTLSKNNNIWMCVTPNEMNTMKRYIDEAHGEVITFGLGLGYYAFMASNKDNVKSVTIIEKDKNIIELFVKEILPLFPHQEKVKIKEEEAISYIKRDGLKEYDYAFFDLWHNAEDGLPLYLQIKALPIKAQTVYWIEESLICMYRRCLLTIIEESLLGYSDDHYRRARNDIDKIINKLYFLTKPLKFTSYQDIERYLSKTNLLMQMKKGL